MRIFEVLEAKKKPVVDLDDGPETPEVDADQDKIPHILMQLRKAVDVDGNYPIMFKDGSKAKLEMEQIVQFIKKYVNAKTDEKEMMQNQAGNSLDGFMAVIQAKDEPKPKHKIKGDRYMSHFSGDFDDK